MRALARRLRAAGFDAETFSHGSLRKTPADSAEDLAGVLRGASAGAVHIVAHSLGGLVVLHLAARGGLPRSGRVVFLGVPAKGSAAARVLDGRRLTRPLLGRGARGGLLGGAPAWTVGHDLGIVVGTKPRGVGRFITRLSLPNDGTVTVAETHVEGATDRVALPVTHTGLLSSRDVADAVAGFLRTGRFPDPGVERWSSSGSVG